MAVAIGYIFLWEPTVQTQQQIELQRSEAAKVYQDDAYISDSCEIAPVAVSTKPQCLNAEREAAKEGQRSNSDLEAQQTVAVWTQAMGKAAILGTGVGIVGLFLIFTTFWETRRAANASRELLELERSPLPILKPIDGEKVEWTDEGVGYREGEKILPVRVKIENTGRNVAIITAITRKWAIINGDGSPPELVRWKNFWTAKGVRFAYR